MRASLTGSWVQVEYQVPVHCDSGNTTAVLVVLVPVLGSIQSPTMAIFIWLRVQVGDQIPVRCDLGTDCSDCGPYEALQPARKLPGNQGPISRLTGRNITVLTRLTNTRPGFMMPYTDPKQVALLACMGCVQSPAPQVPCR